MALVNYEIGDNIWIPSTGNIEDALTWMGTNKCSRDVLDTVVFAQDILQ